MFHESDCLFTVTPLEENCSKLDASFDKRIYESEILAQSNKVTKVKLSQCLMKGNLIQGLVSNKNFKVGRVFSMVIRSVTDRPNSAWGSIETMTIGKRTPLDWQ